jgi:hypothetical protein
VAKFGSSTVVVSLSEVSQGTARVITPYVSTISGIAVESITQQSNPFGTSTEAHTPVGMTKTPDIVLSGFYDDTASVGSWTVMKPSATDIAVGSTGRNLIITAVTGNTFTINVHIVKMEIILKNGSLVEYACTLRQMGAGAWSS